MKIPVETTPGTIIVHVSHHMLIFAGQNYLQRPENHSESRTVNYRHRDDVMLDNLCNAIFLT